MTNAEVVTGYAAVNGVEMYYESRGTGGTPLIVSHGGFGLISMSTALLDELATDRQVIAIEMQGHGHTADIDRPFSMPAFGDDLGELINVLELPRADLLGYSLGGHATLRATIQHPGLIRRQVLVSVTFRRDNWFPDVLAGMDQISSAGFEMMKQAPFYTDWAAVAPDRESFPTLMDKTGDMLRSPYDWTDEVAAITTPTLLVYGDADSIPPSHAAEFYAALGGGLADAGWDGSGLGRNRLAILPGRTHYDVFAAPELVPVLRGFLA